MASELPVKISKPRIEGAKTAVLYDKGRGVFLNFDESGSSKWNFNLDYSTVTVTAPVLPIDGFAADMASLHMATLGSHS